MSPSELRKRLQGRGGYPTYRVIPGTRDVELEAGWAQRNLVTVTIPQLRGIAGATRTGRVYCHRLMGPALCALFASWWAAELGRYILTWNGCFVPRLMRKFDVLSEHSLGLSFDINADHNRQGHPPAAADQPGTVLPLLTLARAHGFGCGADWPPPRVDAMHFGYEGF